MNRRWLRAAAIAAAAVVTSLIIVTFGGEAPEKQPKITEPPVAPALWNAPNWEKLLGGDTGITDAELVSLDNYTDLGEDAKTVKTEAADVLTARLTGEGTSTWPNVFSEDPFGGDGGVDTQLAGTCTKVQIRAVSSMRLPVTIPAAAQIQSGTKYAKSAVAWSGTCNGTGAPAEDEIMVAYTYSRYQDGSWTAVAESSIPGSGWRWTSAAETESVVDGTCGGVWKAAADVAAAFDVMCKDAAADGVTLKVISGLRNAAEQQRLYDQAAIDVGEKNAKKWVRANSGGICTSRHCSGDAIDVEADNKALTWLNTALWCSGESGARTEVNSNGGCDAGVAVPRHLSYGFITPYTHIPNHLEWGVNRDNSPQGGCSTRGSGVPETIAATWRCQLALTGLPADQIVAAAAGAVAQARCASGWVPAAEAEGGRYTETEDPRTGKLNRGRGVHLITINDAGGSTDVSTNAAQATQLWIASREAGGDGWENFPCAEAARGDTSWAYKY